MFIFIISIFFSSILSSVAHAEIIIPDIIAARGEKIMLQAETRGNLFRKGGELVEFFIDGESIGRTLSGGDGVAYKEYTPGKIGTMKITVKSAHEQGSGLLRSLKKGTGIVLIDFEGSMIEKGFSFKPKEGSKNAIEKISKRFPIVLLQTGMLSTTSIKKWMSENGFIDMPIVSWGQGVFLEEIHERGLKIKAIIGSQNIIEYVKEDKPRAFSFEEGETSEEVKDWMEIYEKMRKM